MHDSTDPILFITSNPGKVEEVQRFLGLPVEHLALNLPEIQSLNSEDIVRVKAEFAFAQLGRPVLVEDVSLTFAAFGALPGPFIKFFEQEIGLPGLCHLVDDKDRSCVASVTFGYHDGTEVHYFTGEMPGRVAEAPRGERSFGWSSIVIPQQQPEGELKTYAEMSDEEQESVAMRKLALQRLRTFLG